jgi:hypothetical protein
MFGLDLAPILVGLVIAAAVILMLAAAATGIRDGQALHDLGVEVHTLRNRYLAELRGEEIIDSVPIDGEPEAAGSIQPEPGDARRAA